MPTFLLEKPTDRATNALLRLSVSKIKTFKSCKLKYKYTYIDYLPPLSRDYFVFGNFAHKVLETFHAKIIAGDVRPLNEIMSDCFRDAKKQFAAEIKAEQLKELWNILFEYLNKLHVQKKQNEFPNVLTVEKGFYINFDNQFMLNGVIDRTQLDPDSTLHVMDYKTTSKVKYLQKDDFQLLVYAYVKCLEDPTIKNIRASYILLKHGFDVIMKQYDRPTVNKMEGKLIKIADEIKSEKLWRPQVSILCRWCDYVGRCQAGKVMLKNSGHDIDYDKFGESNW